ncbi:MAG TPA: tetratricopeptide repeat protein [Treponemataceae bacterium]|nr:tetratricopeptide repeat protein [Treponemataceae bacterium]HPS44424.1 tetratricopeptide repeat protein [Treponemataceae bacterium]
MNSSFTFAIVVIIGLVAVLGLSFLGKKRDASKARPAKKRDRASIIREATRRLAQNPRDPEGLQAMGALYYQEQDWEKAYAAYEVLVDLAPTNPKLDEFECSLRFGVSAVKTNRLQEAIKGFLLARKIKPEHFEVSYNLGYICYLQKEYEKAIPFLKQALITDGENVLAQRYMGFSLHKAHRYRDALSYLKKALDLQPDDKEALFAMAECLFESGAVERALKIFTHLRPDPALGPQSALYSGIIHAQTNQNDKAIVDFDIGLKHENIPQDIAMDLRYKLALTLIKSQDLGRALTVLKEIQRLTPGYKDVPTLIVRYQELNQNKNLQTYLMAVQSEFVTLCRKIVVQFFPGAKVKITDISVFADYSDVVAEIDTPKWSDIVIFRFFRSQGAVGELLLRDFHGRIKDLKAGKGICLSAGMFSEESRRFTEGRPIDLYDKDRLNKILNAVDSGVSLKA